MSLKENQKCQNQHLRDITMGKMRELFGEYLAHTPSLYDGVELDAVTINYLNEHFYPYNVNPVTFQRLYINTLKRVAPIYNNMKAIELIDDVSKTVTSKTVRKLVMQAANQLSRTNGGSVSTTRGNDITTHDGEDEITNRFNRKYKTIDDTETAQDITTTTKQASKNLPMQSSGTFNAMTELNNGASAANKTEANVQGDASDNTVHKETQYEDDSVKNSESVNTEYGHTITQSFGTVTEEDRRTLQDIASNSGQDDETIEQTQGLVAELTKKIWDYLAAPKAIDWLISELEPNFILVY